MTGKFIKFLMVAVLLFTATVAVAGPEDLVITTSGRDVHLCVGDTCNLKVYANDTTGEITDFHYQWLYSPTPRLTTDDGWVEIAGATQDTLALLNVSATASQLNAGYYFCKVFFGFNYMSSRKSVRMSVDVASGIPTVGSISAPSYVCEGASLHMEAFNIEGQLSTVWYFGDEVVSHGNAYNVTSALPENAGVYHFVANNACGENVSDPYEISVVELPRIVTQPRSAALCGGDDLTFNVVATGTDLQYQWYYNNAPYPSENTSATTSSLVIEHANHDPEFYSNTFNVQVSNICATVTSRNVGTIVSEVPEIVGNPESIDTCAGIEVTISANATTHYPTDTLTYQWFYNGRPFEGGDVNTLVFAMDSAHMGEFYCEITNGCGSVRTTAAYLMVKMPPTVETQPQDVSVCEGEEARLFTKITGIEPISYNWYNSNGEGLDYTDIHTDNVSGKTSNTLIANPAAEVHERYYYCMATNECGSVRTDTVYMQINQEIAFSPALPQGISVCSGVDTTISIADHIWLGSERIDEDDFAAEGITFAWHKQGETEIVSTEPYLHFSNLQDDDAGRYVCDITNSCGTFALNYNPHDATTHPDNILISVVVSPTILVQPRDLDVCTGGSLSLSLDAEGDGLRYTWYRNGEYLGNNHPTYTAPTVASEYGGEYWCVVNSEIGCAAAYSDTVTVTVSTTPAITWGPTPAVLSRCEGEEYELTMSATGDGINYQWYNNGVALPGQTSNILHIDHVTRSNNGDFYCKVSNACDEVITPIATLTVDNAPDMTLGPDLNPCRGEAVVLGPLGNSEYGHYSWNYGSYGYQPTLTVSRTGTYILEVSDTAHENTCVARDTIVVTFHDYFNFNHANFDTTPIITCGEFVLDAGAGAAEYQWSTTEMTSSITVGMDGYYMVTVDGDGYGCTTSAAVNVTIGDELVINLGNDITISKDSVVEIGVSAVYDSYLWNTGFTGPKLTVDGEEYGVGNHTFWLRVWKGECQASDTIVINFIENGSGQEGEYVDEENMPALNIYPNPASDYVNIVSENGEISVVQVYDMTGRLIVDRNVNEESLVLNVAAMVDTTYFVRVIYTDGKASVRKLIINR